MELYTRHHGSGPPLVMLHGLFGSHENLGVLARSLADEFTIYAMDLRNHGRSPHAAAMDYPTMAADVAETMDAHGLDHAILLGHSLGGKVAMELALTNPDRVRALVVLDIAPVAYDRNHDTELDAMRSLDTASLHSRSDADRALADSITNPGIRQFLLKNLVRSGDGLAWRIPLDTIVEQYPQIAAAPSAGQYDGPTLFVRGGHSDYITSDGEAAIAARFPRATVETFEQAAHWLHAETPNDTAQTIRTFLHQSIRSV